MLCSYCNAWRSADDSPCQNCGAPSSIYGNAENTQIQSSNQEAFQSPPQWGSQPLADTWEANPRPKTGQLGSPGPFAQMPQDNSEIQQLSFDNNETHQVDFRQSLVPVNNHSPNALALPHIPAPNSMAVGPVLPNIPADEESIYIPPMYTKARPIIPRYRAISGFVSFMLVLLAACSGLTYWAQTTGKIEAAYRFVTGAAPATLTSTTPVVIPDPRDTVEDGPAANDIPSVVLAKDVDKNNIAIEPVRIFHTGDVIHIVVTTRESSKGMITLKWYMNDNLFSTDEEQMDAPDKQQQSLHTQRQYRQASSGKVEIYWDGKLAKTVYFAVRD